MNLPYSLKDITVEKYQEVAPLLTEMDLDKWIQVMAILSSKTIEEVEDIDTKDFRRYKSQLSFLVCETQTLIKKFIWIGGSLYRGTNNAEDLNTSQIVAIKTFLNQGGAIEQLHNLSPCCYRKLTLKGWKFNGDDHIKLSKAFLKKPAGDILPIVFFCSKVLLNSIQDSETYSNSLKIVKDRMEEINLAILDGSFSITGGGTLQ